jgi:hypothetical protein
MSRPEEDDKAHEQALDGLIHLRGSLHEIQRRLEAFGWDSGSYLAILTPDAIKPSPVHIGGGHWRRDLGMGKRVPSFSRA